MWHRGLRGLRCRAYTWSQHVKLAAQCCCVLTEVCGLCSRSAVAIGPHLPVPMVPPGRDQEAARAMLTLTGLDRR